MKSTKRGLAVLLAALLAMPTLSVQAEEGEAPQSSHVVQEESISATDSSEGNSDGTEESGQLAEVDQALQEDAEADVPEDGGTDSDAPDNHGTDLDAPDYDSVDSDVPEDGGTDSDAPDDHGTDLDAPDYDGADSDVPEDGEGDASEVIPEEILEFGNAGVIFSTGGEYQLVVNPSVSNNEEYEGFTGIFDVDGSYTIQIPEEDPFFPYEVQFVDFESGGAQNLWFMTPDSVVEFGGHTFQVEADFTGNVVTQFSLNIAGDVVVVYPEEKQFGGATPMSLLPLEEKSLSSIDLTGYTPLELTMVSVDSIFTGKVELKDTDKIMWTTRYSSDSVPDYKVTQKGGFVNLAYAYNVQMIVGEQDQLAADNIRYTAYLSKSDYTGWLTPTFYTQDDNGNRTQIAVKRDTYYNSSDIIRGSRYEYGYERIYLSSIQGNVPEGYLALQVNSGNYAKTKFTSVKAYEGMHETAAEAMAAVEITNEIFSADMTQTDAGHRIRRYPADCITLVSFDAQGNVTGCLPVKVYYENVHNGMYIDWMRDASGNDITAGNGYYDSEDSCRYYTQRLYSGRPANGNYIQSFMYYNDGTIDNTVITAAYVGLYSSIAEAAAAGAEDVKDILFKGSPYPSDDAHGYAGDYSAGIYFTVFIGADGTENQQVWKYNVMAVESDSVSVPSSNTTIYFNGLLDSDGKSVSTAALQDSYAENNYVVFLVDDDVDRSNLALKFSPNTNPKLYASGSSEPEVSGKSYHDFSKGAVQFTASAEDGVNSKNYWVQVITRSAANGQIFMNSLTDSSVSTTNVDGVIYTTREMLLDSLHDYKHDIMFANMGTEAIDALSAELVSDVVELDDYWTLTGNHELSGFTTTDRTTSYGRLSNLAMLRLREKAGVEAGTDITGTLTIKSGAATLMVITLTGIVGDPVITTKEVPAAVKYVPYGTMIQSSNKYNWNTVRFELQSGILPEGMVIKPNGELYGVPREVGEFTFEVRMTNSYGSFTSDTREFTLVVMENTDENVEGQTDASYELTDRVTYDYGSWLGDQLMVSQGVYGEFVDLWLDGQKLTEGVDYTSESGSTRITIFAQTLSNGKENGTHTLGIEFRTSATDTLKRAAQNYVLSSAGSSSSGNSSSSSNGGNGSSATGFQGVVADVGVTYYTVQSGDSLWKIAAQFFGDGNQWRKIYEDNRDTLNDPDKIYVGQVLKIMATINAGSQNETTDAVPGGIYTVQPGDCLWEIAQKAYGNGRRWNKIYEANTDKISDPSRISIGQVLVIPED